MQEDRQLFVSLDSTEEGLGKCAKGIGEDVDKGFSHKLRLAKFITAWIQPKAQADIKMKVDAIWKAHGEPITTLLADWTSDMVGCRTRSRFTHEVCDEVEYVALCSIEATWAPTLFGPFWNYFRQIPGPPSQKDKRLSWTRSRRGHGYRASIVTLLELRVRPSMWYAHRDGEHRIERLIKLQTRAKSFPPSCSSSAHVGKIYARTRKWQNFNRRAVVGLHVSLSVSKLGLKLFQRMQSRRKQKRAKAKTSETNVRVEVTCTLSGTSSLLPAS